MKSPKIGIITQARISSTRLPEKVLLKMGQESVLGHHLSRLSKTQLPLFIATTPENGATKIAAIGKKFAAEIFIGPLDDVLTRFYACAKSYDLDYIIRVTSDCPLIDPELVLQGVNLLLGCSNPERTYISNTIDRTYARGFDFEIFSMSLLRQAHLEGVTLPAREHVTPYLYSGADKSIFIQQVKQSVDHSNLRVTLDTREDFDLIKTLIENYDANNLSHKDIEQLLIANSWLRAINAHIEQKKV